MSRIVFVLSEDSSAFIRGYCEKHGSNLDGLADTAVSCLMDVMSDDWGGPWMPDPDGLATGHDLHSEGIAARSTIWEAAQDEADAVRTMLDLRAIAAELGPIGSQNDGDATGREVEQCAQALQDAESEAEASRGISAELRRTATEGAILECVRELRAAGMSVRAIADELSRLGGARIPAKKGIK